MSAESAPARPAVEDSEEECYGNRLSLRRGRCVRMRNPSHPGELIRVSMEEKGWTATECAARLGVARPTLSRVLNGRARVSPMLALALERIGWSDADHWLRMQASYDLARARAAEAA